MKQCCLTISMGKRLLGKAMAAHPDIDRVLEKGALNTGMPRFWVATKST